MRRWVSIPHTHQNYLRCARGLPNPLPLHLRHHALLNRRHPRYSAGRDVSVW